jgi:glycosyltransferase involved in cell wall biosynthesis
MRVAFVAMETTRHVDRRGTRRFERVARQLATDGHEVTLFCGQFWDDYDDEIVIDGLRYKGVSLGTATPAFCARLPALLAAYQPDVIHVRPEPPQQVLAAETGAKFARAPLVLEWFGDEALDEGHRLTRWATRTPDLIVTPSELVRTRVRENGATDEGTTVIPEGIDFDRVSTVEPADSVDVAFAHPLDASANIEDLLLGLAELRERDWTATIVGDGPKRAAYEQEVADLRIDDRITFAGACDRERRLAIYRGAHAFVQTAYREDFATELLWALACGCVGVVEYQAESSAHELIENYDRSYRVTDPQELANAIVDAAEFERLTEDDHWTAYDHTAIAEQYLDAYERLQGTRQVLSR